MSLQASCYARTVAQYINTDCSSDLTVSVAGHSEADPSGAGVGPGCDGSMGKMESSQRHLDGAELGRVGLPKEKAL